MAHFNNPIIANSALFQDQWKALQAERKRVDAHNLELAQRQGIFANSAITIPQSAYQEMDRQIIEYSYRVDGGDILEDLDRLITPVNVGKTLRTYNKGSDQGRNRAISLDGNEPLKHDHVTYSSDGDPIPVFSEGWGANWREVAGLNSIDVNVLLDSQRLASAYHAEDIVNYTLNGNTRINVSGFEGQGLKNHRNTFKIDLGASGLNVDLVTADLETLSTFFHKTLRTQLDNNHVRHLDKLWVSPEIYQNLTTKMALITGGRGDLGASILDYLGVSIPVRSIGDVLPSYALKGNEFLGYVADKRYIEIPVGMPTTITPLERKYFNENYNFRVDTIRGLHVKADFSGKSGVFYGSNLT